MVALEAPSPPPDLPTLSQEDSALLHRYWSLGEDLAAIAKDADQPLMTLLAWTLRPDVRAWITARRRQEDDLNVRLAINTLITLVRTSEDPVEKRRAASVLLRAYTRQWHPSPARGQRPADEPAPTPDDIDALDDREADEGPNADAPAEGSSPRPDGERVAEGRVRGFSSSPPPTLEGRQALPAAQHSAPSPQSFPPPPEPPLVLAEPPPGTPELSRDATPEQVAAWALAALANPSSHDALEHAIYALRGRDPKARTAEAVRKIAEITLKRTGIIPGFRSCNTGPLIVGHYGWGHGWARQESVITLITGERRRLTITLALGYTPAVSYCWHLHDVSSTPIKDPPPKAPADHESDPSPESDPQTTTPPQAPPQEPRPSRKAPQPSAPSPQPFPSGPRLIHPTPLTPLEPRRPNARLTYMPGFGNTS